jgi:hypothetical protein
MSVIYKSVQVNDHGHIKKSPRESGGENEGYLEHDKLFALGVEIE